MAAVPAPPGDIRHHDLRIQDEVNLKFVDAPPATRPTTSAPIGSLDIRGEAMSPSRSGLCPQLTVDDLAG
jgi:hypothetical protein